MVKTVQFEREVCFPDGETLPICFTARLTLGGDILSIDFDDIDLSTSESVYVQAQIDAGEYNNAVWDTAHANP